MTGRVIVLRGDAAHLPLPDGSVDACVTDPPYALTELPTAKVVEALTAWLGGDRAYIPKTGAGGFMGRDWDKFVPPPGAWDECLRVLKPGGWLLAFAAPRTQDLMGMSIRLAGFEIRDGIDWIFGQGMPKSLDVSKAIDKAAGAEREVVGHRIHPTLRNQPKVKSRAYHVETLNSDANKESWPLTAPATEDAARWEGFGTALKPANEPVIMARKPLAGTVVANVLTHGTGALNIAACQVGAEPRTNNAGGASSLQRVSRVEQGYRPNVTTSRNEASEVAGRWPPNVVFSHDPNCVPVGTRMIRGDNRTGGTGRRPGGFANIGADSGTSEPNGRLHGDAEAEAWDCAPGCPVAELDAQSGISRSSGGDGRGYGPGRKGIYGDFGQQKTLLANAGGLGDTGGASRYFPVFRYEAKADTASRPRLPDGTTWPTVKPVPLIRWLPETRNTLRRNGPRPVLRHRPHG